jgi:hypothetical protein
MKIYSPTSIIFPSWENKFSYFPHQLATNVYYYIVINIFLLISMENNRAIYPCICTLVASLRSIFHLNMNKFSYLLYPHAINVLLYRMKPRKHIYRYVKYCWQAYFKSIGTYLFIVVDVVYKCLRQRSNGLKICLPSVFFMYVFSWFHSV